MNLTLFIESIPYSNFLDELDYHLPEGIDRESEIYLLVSKILVKWLEFSSVTVDDLHWLILNEHENLIKFIVLKQEKYTDPDGGDSNIHNETPNLSFPVSHMIEFYLLLKKPAKLLPYLNSARFPSAKKYADEIFHIFSEVRQ